MSIVRVFFETDMRLSFEGLVKIANDSKLDLSTLSEKSMVLFMNTKRTRFKVLFGQGKYMVYYSNGNRVLPLEAIRYFPQFFNGRDIAFDKAIRQAVIDKLGAKRTQLEKVA